MLAGVPSLQSILFPSKVAVPSGEMYLCHPFLLPCYWHFFHLNRAEHFQVTFIFYTKENREEPHFKRCLGARAASSKAESMAFWVVAWEKEMQQVGDKHYCI